MKFKVLAVMLAVVVLAVFVGDAQRTVVQTVTKYQTVNVNTPFVLQGPLANINCTLHSSTLIASTWQYTTNPPPPQTPSQTLKYTTARTTSSVTCP